MLVQHISHIAEFGGIFIWLQPQIKSDCKTAESAAPDSSESILCLLREWVHLRQNCLHCIPLLQFASRDKPGCLSQESHSVFTLNNAGNESQAPCQGIFSTPACSKETKIQEWKPCILKTNTYYTCFNDPSPPFLKKGWWICQGQIHSKKNLCMLHWSLIAYLLACLGMIYAHTTPAWVVIRKRMHTRSAVILHQCWRCVYHVCIFFVSPDRTFFEPGIKQTQRMTWLSPSYSLGVYQYQC